MKTINIRVNDKSIEVPVKNNEITQEGMDLITSMNPVSISVSYSELEVFETCKEWVNLERLECNFNKLTTLQTHKEWVNLEWLECGFNKLTSLQTHKEWVSLERLYCHVNNLTTLNLHKEWVNLRLLYCGGNKLTSLQTHREWVNMKYLYCHINNLTTLQTHKEWVNMKYLYCYTNKLTSLDTHKEWVNLELLHCRHNKLTSLQTHREWVNMKYLYCDKEVIINNGNTIIKDNILSHIISRKVIDNHEVILDHEGRYVVFKDGFNAHGDSLKEALGDCKFKILNDTLDKTELIVKIKDKNTLNPLDYRLLTGACKLGVREFLEKHSLPYGEIELSKVVELTKGHFGHEELVKLIGD